MNQECCFCKELERGYLEINKENKGNRIITETDNFVVFPALGPIVEGHVLITSKEHYIGVGGVPKEFYEELEEIQKKVRSALKEIYGKSLFFEHGASISGEKSACCIEHTHIHALPVNVDVEQVLTEKFPKKRIGKMEVLQEYFKNGKPYFFVETNDIERSVFDIPDIVPSQYIRQIIATSIRKPERWDWGLCLGMEDMERTKEVLKEKLKHAMNNNVSVCIAKGTTKMTAHQIGVKAIIEKDGKILLLKRSEKYEHLKNQWDIPGGRIKFGEEPEEGLKREIQEETGLELKEIKQILDASTVFKNEEKHIVRITYLCTVKDGVPKTSHEHTHIAWITKENIKELGIEDKILNKIIEKYF